MRRVFLFTCAKHTQRNSSAQILVVLSVNSHRAHTLQNRCMCWGRWGGPVVSPAVSRGLPRKLPPFRPRHVFHLNEASCVFCQLELVRQEERPPVFVAAPRPVWAGDLPVTPEVRLLARLKAFWKGSSAGAVLVWTESSSGSTCGNITDIHKRYRFQG